MNEAKIIRPLCFARASTEPVSIEVQASLFLDRTSCRGLTSFVHINTLSEEILLRLVSRYGIAVIVDLRPRPVFERPKFRHREVVGYFFTRSIKYIEYAMISNAEIDEFSIEKRKEILRNALPLGMTLFLFDDAATEKGWVGEMRHDARISSEFRTEMHPRSLMGH